MTDSTSASAHGVETPLATLAQAPAGGAAPGHGDSSLWSSFATAATDEVFCSAWLALQCAAIDGVRAALLLLREPAGEAYVPAAVWPQARRDLTYLTGAAERALSERRGTVIGLHPDEADRVEAGTVHVAYPVEVDGEITGAVVLDVDARSESALQHVLRCLLWGAGWLEALMRRRELARNAGVLDRASVALDLMQLAQEQDNLNQAAMALVNELVDKVAASRVSLGIERKGKLKLLAVSRTAWFDAKSQLVEQIENAMEEAIDQEAAVAYPVLPTARAKVVVAQKDLAVRAGAAAVLSVPVISRGAVIGALTLERDAATTFAADTVLLCEVLGALLGPVLEAKLESERWLAGKLVHKLSEWRNKLVGPRAPAFKLSALALLLLVLFVIFADGEFRVSARTVVEGAVQRAAVAPFDGYVRDAYVRAGEDVRKGAVLAVLDDRDLKLEQSRWASEREQAERKYREALAMHDRADARVLAAQVSQADAQLTLTQEKLERTRLLAPFDAVVVSGDLSQILGTPVEKGTVLFELAPLDKYRVILKVDERDIAFVSVGQAGELALTGLTDTTLPFTIKTVTSVATAEEGRNFFRVEAQIEADAAGLRPGMEGVGKLAVDERRLVWIWTRNFVSWLRISLWRWLP